MLVLRASRSHVNGQLGDGIVEQLAIRETARMLLSSAGIPII
jgi:hypothetical protein